MVEVLGDRYELGGVLGTGGMSQVREAIDRRLDRRVAVKLVAGGGVDVAVRARFLQETRLAARFTHPHAVTVFDAGQDGGALFLVMELVSGPTLARVLADRGPLDPAEAVAVADQVLAALGAAHHRGLVHRDIKPSNILFTDDGEAKLGDFGIAKGTGEWATTLTATGQLVGTPRYLSPEQVAGLRATPASDLYAIGVVLWEMLTGSPPFGGETPFAAALAHQREPVPSLVDRRPELDRDLAGVVEWALAKSPADRYPDAAAMRAALRNPAAAMAARDHETIPSAAAVVSTRRFDTEAMAGSPAGRRPPRWRRSAVLVPMAVAAAGLGAAALLLTRPDPGGERPEASARPTTTTTTVATTTTTRPPTTATTVPPTIGTLTDLLAAGPASYGDKGQDLLDKLQEVQSKTGSDQANQARDLIEEILKWMDEGNLDPDIGQQAISVLQPLAAPADDDND